ncbi:huntingtin-like [Macrobrachium nipponense]|uniref:huntingtin-like n=1 Tax=Macrobrachium nipponense TaxID=159736 RepID=UPI0030C7E964
MATLEKLVKAFEAVKLSQGNSGGGLSATLGGGNVTNEQRPPEHTSTMASLASSISQQSQGLLSKKDQVLNSKDKAATCTIIADALVGAKTADIQKLLSVGIETLLLLTADADPDVRMNANEALNRVIRSLSETQLGKIQVELYKEIKKNGSVRSLRAALTRFASLCHHIRPQKGRAYVQNLLPYITRMARRTEEPLLETLATSLEKIMPTLGHFTNDNEIKNLLKSFLPNLNHTSSAVRRSAVSSLIILCCHSRKPPMFLGWLLSTILQTLVPVVEDLPNSQVLGCLLCLRALVPHIVELCAPIVSSDGKQQSTNILSVEYTVTYDQILQVFELCLHYSAHADHNIVTASLETLQTLLQSPPLPLLVTLTSMEGITRSRIYADPRTSNLSSRAPSQISVAPSLFEEDSPLLDFEGVSGRTSIDLDTPDGRVDLEEGLKEEDDKGGGGGGGGGGEGGVGGSCGDDDGKLEDSEAAENSRDSDSDLYASIEIGKVTDSTPLFDRREIDLSSESTPQTRDKRKLHQQTSSGAHNKSLEEKSLAVGKASGNIGSLFEEELPVRYLVRYLSSSFLLSGHVGSLISDRAVRVSVKVLALNCVGLAVMVMPSLMGEPLFIDPAAETELQQHVDDILRYHGHSDPQLGASVATVIGQYIRASLIHGGGQYNDLGRPGLALSSLLEVLCKLLGNESSVTSRGAVAGLSLCLNELLRSWHASVVLSVLPHIVNTALNPYWLVKVELCELLGGLPLSYIDHLENSNNYGNAGNSVPVVSGLRQSDRFSHRVSTAVLIPLLGDQDHRVRTAAASACVELVPEIMSTGDLIQKVASDLVQGGHLKGHKKMNLPSQQNWSSRSLPSLPVAPLHRLLSDGWNMTERSEASHDGQNCRVSQSLSRLIYAFTSQLLCTSNKFLMLGCIEALAQLSERCPPALYPAAWGCHIPLHKLNEGHTHIGLVTMVLSLAGEAPVAGDLTVQQNILTVASNIITGIAVEALRQGKEDLPGGNKMPWSLFGMSQMVSVAEAVVQHIMRVLCVYTHVLEEIVPGSRPTLAPLAPPAAISPIKRRSRAESTGEKNRTHSPSKGEKADGEEKERKSSKPGAVGTFAHLPEYIKMYDVLKNAYTNYKMSLEDSTTEKLCGLLRVALTCLGRLLEVSSMLEFGRLADELLQYLKVVTSLLPTLTVQCGQQLLKCLFGSNVKALFDQIYRKSSESNSRGSSDCGGSNGKQIPEGLEVCSLHYRCFTQPLTQLENDLTAISESRQDGDPISLSGNERKGSSNLFKTLGRGNDKSSLSSYIRLFEPLVIKALKLYTVSSDVIMQRSVLQLLIHLVQIRVNYCLLDSDQIFIGYVIKQFEYIEEGQIKQAEELIPSMFRFLVLLSYERHHSKSIIGVPKIIQLCDGLLASGQPPLSHCIKALQPLVEDLFLVRSTTSSADQRELDTQREVLCSMLLRLAHYHQVLHLISLVLGATMEANRDRWRKLSRQVIDTLLPLLSKLQVNLDSEESLSAVEEVMNGVCPSVYRPVDCLLKALFTSPCELESTVGVERWVGSVLLLLRTLISHSSPELVLARLEELGLSMDYVHSDVSADSTTAEISTAPEVASQQSTDSSSFRDPLNVTQPGTLPQVAMARFLLEVVRVSVSEIRSVRLSLLNSGSSLDVKSSLHSPDLLVHLSHHLLLTLLHLTVSGQWREVIGSFKDICSNESELMEEVSEALLFVSGWYPSLTLSWCKLLTCLDLTSQNLWTRVLRTCQRKSVTSISNPVVSEGSGPSSCLSLEFMRRCGLLVFSEFVVSNCNNHNFISDVLCLLSKCIAADNLFVQRYKPLSFMWSLEYTDTKLVVELGNEVMS